MGVGHGEGGDARRGFGRRGGAGRAIRARWLPRHAPPRAHGRRAARGSAFGPPRTLGRGRACAAVRVGPPARATPLRAGASSLPSRAAALFARVAREPGPRRPRRLHVRHGFGLRCDPPDAQRRVQGCAALCSRPADGERAPRRTARGRAAALARDDRRSRAQCGRDAPGSHARAAAGLCVHADVRARHAATRGRRCARLWRHESRTGVSCRISRAAGAGAR
mmetsp:Transcript_14550/g.45518  ORF Transcript_14550/g.45518 Transcript_14550/m.45518 type:complete len:222 (+) Transcript_14550:280-945(+)